MKFLQKLSLFSAALIALSGSASAFDFDITQNSCTTYTWSIILSHAEWVGATYAQFYILNDANVNDDPVQHTVTITSSGDIQTWDVPYTFQSYIPYDQLPSGSTWDIGIALLDSGRNVITSEVRGAEVPDDCPNGSSGGSGSSTPATITFGSSISASATATPSITAPVGNNSNNVPISTPTPTPKPSHTAMYVGAAVGAVVVIAIVAAAIFFLLRKKRQQEHGNLHGSPSLEKGLHTSSDPVASMPHLSHQSDNDIHSNFYSSPPTSPRVHPQQFGSWHAS